MVSPATGIEDAGGDWYHEGGIILSKKPPEWHLSPPLHEFRVRFCYSLPQRRMVPPAASMAATVFRIRFYSSLSQRRIVSPAVAVAAAIFRVRF